MLDLFAQCYDALGRFVLSLTLNFCFHDMNLLRLFCFLLLPFAFSSAQQATSNYIGSSQFFDLSGTWVNENQDTTRRVARMEISPTIINTYRVVPYFALGEREFPAPSVSLSISERQLFYTTTILEAQCYLVPMLVGNQQKLKVYSIIVNAAGTWLGMVSETLIRDSRTNERSQKANLPTNFAEQATGYWINEWPETQILPKLQLVRADNGEMQCKLYRIINDKVRLLGTYPLGKSQQPDQTHLITETRGEVITTYHVRPIYIDQRLVCLDVLVEEIYNGGVPKDIFRQFFVKDPNAEMVAYGEGLLQQLRGEWENVDPASPTVQLIIQEDEIELFGKTLEDNQGIRSLGKQVMRASQNDEGLKVMYSNIPSVSSVRMIELDVESIQLNKQFPQPVVMVVTSTVEDAEGLRPPDIQSEVFRRKEVLITGKLLGLE